MFVHRFAHLFPQHGFDNRLAKPQAVAPERAGAGNQAVKGSWGAPAVNAPTAPTAPTHPDLTGVRGGYESPYAGAKPKIPGKPVDPTPPSPPTEPTPEPRTVALPDGLKPTAGANGLADNVGNSVTATFDAAGQISGLTTGRTQAEGPDQFSGATFTFDADAQLLTAQSAIAVGQPPVEPEPMGETLAFQPTGAPQPVTDANGQLIGFAEEGFADGDGDAVTVTRDANGDIDGFQLEQRRPIGGADAPFTDIRIRIFALDGTLIAEAQS